MPRQEDKANTDNQESGTQVRSGPDIFISYAHEDHETAHQLANALSEQGWEVWWDREISGGAAFADVITENLARTRLTLVLWSQASVRSMFVRDEASRALDAQKLLPIRIQDVERPIGFGQIQTLDLIDWTGASDAEDLRNVIDEIRHLLQRDPTLRKPKLPPTKPSLRWRFAPTAALLAVLVVMSIGIWSWWPRLNQEDRQRAEDHTLQGINNLAAKEYDQARARFNLAIAANKRFAPAYFYLAQVLIQNDAKEEAGKNLRQAITLHEGLDGAQLAEAERWLKKLETATTEPEPIVVAQRQPSPSAPVDVAATTPALRVPPPPEALTSVSASVEQMFAEQKEMRITATTDLVINPESLSDAIPLALDHALAVQQDGKPASLAAQSGIINALVLLQSALPATLNANREKIEALLQRAQSNGDQTKEQVDKVRAALQRATQQRPLVYIQIANEAQRPWANAFITKLKQAGYDAPGMELVGNKAPAKVSEIRIHGNSDRGWARWLAKKVSDNGADNARTITLRNVKAKNDTFEIWLDRDLCVTPERQPLLCRG
jgi:tetratricopeptide (TPR) repeat protein